MTIDTLPEIFHFQKESVYLRIKKEKGCWKIRYLQNIPKLNGGYITRIKINGATNESLESVATKIKEVVDSIQKGVIPPNERLKELYVRIITEVQGTNRLNKKYQKFNNN